MASCSYETELLGEPTLEEMLADPIVQLIMKRDGVAAHDMKTELDRARRAYGGMVPALQ